MTNEEVMNLMIQMGLHDQSEEWVPDNAWVLFANSVRATQWVGLTDEEVKDFQVNKFVGPNLIRAIERRLKEKNK
jgi:hypothetical protein